MRVGASGSCAIQPFVVARFVDTKYDIYDHCSNIYFQFVFFSFLNKLYLFIWVCCFFLVFK